MKDFNKKIIFIVGGSSGIGLSTAKLLAKKGAHIIIFARDKNRLKIAITEIKDQRLSDNQLFGFMSLDVSVRKKVETIMKKAVSDFGTPDMLINCAGRSYPRHFEDITFDQFDETMKINLYGIWNTISVLLPYMKQKGGHISNVSSIAGFIGVFGFTDYSASKFAIIGFSEALKSELKKYNITVSVLCPPDTDTPAFEVENRTKPEETKAISASAKLMQPDDVAAAFVHGVMKGKFIIIPGVDGKFTYVMKRCFPKIVEFVMDMIIKKVQQKDKEEGSRT
ncbi:MAG: SDR family oxidoreductase [Deltaproteobacteria bacterium]|nr:SDR family oxidoreductase [Deltaproteobacteria bacterium]